MQAGEKFLFDMDFDDLEILKEISEQEVGIEAGAEGEDDEPEEEVITFSEEEMNSQRQLAFEEGRKQGVSETLDGIEKNIADVFTRIDETVSGLFQIQREENEQTRKESISVASAIVEKLFSSLDREHGFDEVIKLTEDTLEGLLREPSIIIHVNDALANSMQERLKEFFSSRDFQGQLSVLGDTNLAAGDCRIEWTTGEAERSSRMVLDAAQDILRQNLNSEPPEETGRAEVSAEPGQPQNLPADETGKSDIIGHPAEPGLEEDTDRPAAGATMDEENKGEKLPGTIDSTGPQIEAETPPEAEATDNLAAQMEQAMPPPDAVPSNGDQSSN